jgi:type VI secretion system protein VasI
MSDIRFNCPSCNQSIEAPEELASQLIDCPTCKQTIEVPPRSRLAHAEVPASREPPSDAPRPAPTARTPPSPQSAEKFGTREIIGIIGAIVLFVGVFTPIVSVPIMGQSNYFQNGKGDGAVVLVLSVLSLAAILVKKDVILFFTSLACLGALTFTFVNFKIGMSRVLADAGRQDDVFSGFANLAFQSVQLQWGWALLVVGACLTLTPLFVKSSPQDSSLPDFFKLASAWRVAAGVLSALCAVTVVTASVWPTSAKPTTPTAVAQAPKERVGWQLRTDISPLDDSKSYFLSRDAEEPIGSGLMRGTPTLMIRYKERELHIYVSFDSYLGSDSTVVTLRLGQSAAKQEEWSLSTDGKAIFCPTDAREFVDQLLQNDRLVIRLTPFGESPITVTFDLAGLSEAIQPMRKVIQR